LDFFCYFSFAKKRKVNKRLALTKANKTISCFQTTLFQGSSKMTGRLD